MRNFVRSSKWYIFDQVVAVSGLVFAVIYGFAAGWPILAIAFIAVFVSDIFSNMNYKLLQDENDGLKKALANSEKS